MLNMKKGGCVFYARYKVKIEETFERSACTILTFILWAILSLEFSSFLSHPSATSTIIGSFAIGTFRMWIRAINAPSRLEILTLFSLRLNYSDNYKWTLWKLIWIKKLTLDRPAHGRVVGVMECIVRIDHQETPLAIWVQVLWKHCRILMILS